MNSPAVVRRAPKIVAGTRANRAPCLSENDHAVDQEDNGRASQSSHLKTKEKDEDNGDCTKGLGSSMLLIRLTTPSELHSRHELTKQKGCAAA